MPECLPPYIPTPDASREQIAFCQCQSYSMLYEYKQGPVGDACKKIKAWWQEKELAEDAKKKQSIIDIAKGLNATPRP